MIYHHILNVYSSLMLVNGHIDMQVNNKIFIFLVFKCLNNFYFII